MTTITREEQNMLEFLFNKELTKLNDFQLYIAESILGILFELVELKEIAIKGKERYWKDLYLVWGAVRDILLWNDWKDWDLTWNYTPEEFQELLGGWTITEKLGTVFFTTENNLEIEYTPFRTESNYDWRRPWNVSFNANLEEDSLRRDFTVNSLYLDLLNMDIIDLYGWIDDLRNWIVRAVWNPDDRFKEDYLRILRGIRLVTKLNWEIEKETYDSMIRNSTYINELSDERIVDEIFKWFNTNLKDWNNKYLYYLDDFWNKNWLFTNILNVYKKLLHTEIYTLFYYILWKDIKKIKKLAKKFSWRTKKIFVLFHEKLKHKNNWNLIKKLKKDMTIEELALFLFNINITDYSIGDYTKFLVIALNNEILEWRMDKDEAKNIIEMKKVLDKNSIIYDKLILKKLWISIPEWIDKHQIKEFQEEVVLSQFK